MRLRPMAYHISALLATGLQEMAVRGRPKTSPYTPKMKRPGRNRAFPAKSLRMGSVHVVVGAALPDIDLVGRGGGVALGVERNLVQHRVELASPHRLLHIGHLDRLGSRGRLRP